MLHALTAAMVMVPVDRMISAPATPESTESLLGPSLIAREEPAPSKPACWRNNWRITMNIINFTFVGMLPGLVLWKMQTMRTLWSNARTRAFATESLVNASASATTKALPAKEPHAPTAAATLASATRKASSLLRLDALTTRHGMLARKLAAFAILDEEALTVL